MKRFLSKKKFWAGILLLISILGMLWYFSQESSENNGGQNGGQSVLLDSLQQDTDPPTILIETPEEQDWQSRPFFVSVFDEDLETAIDMNSCIVEVCSYDNQGKELCSATMQRQCNNSVLIGVGPEEQCRFEGRESCFVFVGATDAAGNKGSAYTSFHIDFTPPRIEENVLKQEAGEYVVQGRVQDENIIARCGLYANDRYIKNMKLMENCGEDCRVSTAFEPEGLESSTLFIRCSDIAGNTVDGIRLFLEVNQAPFIDSCRVIPTKGDLGTEFLFSVVAEDPNQDPLAYFWEFGNGDSGDGIEVMYFYSTPGTYMPKITVRDTEGLSAECSTAWVVVE